MQTLQGWFKINVAKLANTCILLLQFQIHHFVFLFTVQIKTYSPLTEYFIIKVTYTKTIKDLEWSGFSNGHVWMWELDNKESWAPKNWRFWIVMLEKTLESPLDCKEIQPVHPKGDQTWVFIGRTDAEAETPILWPLMWRADSIWKDPDAGKDWGQEDKGTTEDEVVGWHHRLDGHGFGWTLGIDDGQGGLMCCGSRGRRESDTTERLNWTELKALFGILKKKKVLFHLTRNLELQVYMKIFIFPKMRG